MAISPDYFSEEWLRHDLKGKTVRGGVFTAVAQAAQVAVQLATIPILGRLLTPADFGLVAMVSVVTGFASMFIDAGLSTATIQRQRITHGQVTNLFWLAAGLGSAIALIVAMLSPAIAWFYREPRLVPVTIALVVSFVFSGLTIQHQALLRRAMRFRALATVQITSMVAGQAVGILWAWMYRSYWALVWVPVTAALVRMVGTWIACRWAPSLPQRGTGVRPLIGFGAYLTGVNIVSYVARNVDYMLIGWYWGAGPLGLYERAYRLLMQPLLQINAPMSSVAVPALSRLTNEPHRFRSFWIRGCAIAAFIESPLVVCVILVAPELVLTLLGPQWGDAIPVFLALTPAMLLSFTGPATTWVFISCGRPDKALKGSLVSLVVTIIAFTIALPFGIVAMAWSYSITRWMIRPPYIMYCFAGTPLRLRDLWIALRSSIYATTAAAIVSLCIFLTVRFPGPVPVQLVLKSLVFGVAYVVCSMMTAEGRELWQFAISLLKSQLQRRGGAHVESVG